MYFYIEPLIVFVFEIAVRMRIAPSPCDECPFLHTLYLLDIHRQHHNYVYKSH
jgi:hypothetical protein